MKGKKSFVLYTTWRSFFELLEEPELIKELLYAVFDLAEGKEAVITNNKVRTAFNAIEPIMREDLEAYEAKREKNRAAAQKRWNNPDDMRSHTDAMQTDGDNVNANANVNGNANGNVNDIDIDMSVLSGSDAPSVAEVIEVASNHDIELTEAEAKEFITYYFLDRKGELNGEPIRDWRKLLKSWNDHTLVVTDSILGPDHEGYEAFLKLPDDLQERIVDEQTRFGGRNITRATAMAITACRKAV